MEIGEEIERLASVMVHGCVENAYRLLLEQISGGCFERDPAWKEIREVWNNLDDRARNAMDALLRQALGNSAYCMGSVFGQATAPYSDDITGEVFTVGIELMRFQDRDAWAADQRSGSFRLFFDETTYSDELALQCINAFEEWESEFGAEEAQVEEQE